MLINGNFKRKRSLKQASSYGEWMAAAHSYDQYNGLDRWRKKDATGQYDHVSIRIRLDRLQSLKARHNIKMGKVDSFHDPTKNALPEEFTRQDTDRRIRGDRLQVARVDCGGL